MWNKLIRFGKRFKQEVDVYRLVLGHERTPRLARFLLGAAIAYALTPFDLIPDCVPVLGHLDDAVILPALVFGAMRLIPKDDVEECRRRVREMKRDGDE